MRGLKALPILIVVAGCGGGSSSPIGGTNSVPMQIGITSLQVTGTPKSQVFGGNSSLLSTSIAGASITNMVLAPNPIPTVTVGVAVDSAGLIWLIRGRVSSQVSRAGVPPAFSAQFTPDGRIAFLALDNITSSYQIFTCNIDGTEVAKRTNSTNLDASSKFSWSPDNTRIVHDTGFVSSVLYVSSTSGGVDTPVAVPGMFNVADPAWSPDSKRILFSAVPTGGSNFVLENIGADGKGLFPVKALVGSDTLEPTYSIDGSVIAFNRHLSSGSGISTIDALTGRPVGAEAVVSGTYDSEPQFSTDGKHLAFSRLQSLGAINDVFTSSYLVSDISAMAYGPKVNLAHFSYQRPLKPRKFIGVGGVMGTGCSGAIVNQYLHDVSSIITFAAINPSTATITPQGTSGSGGDLAYLLHADSITSLKYTNGYYVPVVILIPGATATATEVLITINSQDGTVANVAPFVKTHRVTESGSRKMFQANFTAIYDASGRNMAPSGAKQLVIDSHTGKLISFR